MTRNIIDMREPPQLGPNPLQQALDDYHRMAGRVRSLEDSHRSIAAENHALLSEVNMLREAYERADSDRIRLQAISSTLLGRLLAINDAIAGAVKESIKHGIEAVAEAKPDPALEQAAEDVQEVLQRVRPIHPTPVAGRALGPSTPPQVDWGVAH